MEIDLSVSGAREERSKLKHLQELLNQEGVVPDQAYRMSKVDYSLVCFVNNMVGLYLSKNYEVIPVFIARAHKHMLEVRPNPSAESYYGLVSIYLRQMAHVLSTFTSVSAESLAFIPEDILNAGAQDIENRAGDTGRSACRG